MKKKVMAMALAAVLALVPSGSILAEEILPEEVMAGNSEAEASAEDALARNSEAEASVEEALAGNSEAEASAEDALAGNSDMEAWPEDASQESFGGELEESLPGEDLVLSVEEVETKDYVAEGNEVVLSEVMTDQAEESGLAENAAYPMLRLFGASQYVDSYGGQLDGNAKAVYDQMVAAYVTDRGSQGIVYTLSEPLTFDVAGTVQDGGLLWDQEGNEGYQEALAQIRYMVQASYDAFVYDYPEVFWIGAPTFSWSMSFRGSGSVNYVGIGEISSVRISPKERYAGASSEISAFDASVNSVYAQLRSQLPASASRKDILRKIHDYLCDTVSYADNDYARTAAGVFLKDKKVVCEGYAKSFKILCGKFGIESALIPGGAKTSGGIEGHMWNYVKMEDGNWYLVDVTWDDQGSHIFDTYFLAGNLTVGFRGITVFEEREQNRYPNFSSSANTQSFAFPVLSDCAYHTDHVWTEYVPDNNGTCEADGTKTAACGVEGCTVKNTVADVGSKKAHQTQYVAAKAAACTEAGNTEYWYCSVCQKYFSDQGGTNEIAQGSTVVPATGHQNTEVRNAKEATCIEEGYTGDTYCKDCGQKVSGGQTISRLPATITVNAAKITLKVNQSTTKLVVSGLGPGDRVVSWSSSNPKVAAVSQSGKITGKKVGTANITITLLSKATKTIKVTVQKTAVKTTGISGLAKKLTIQKGKKATLKPIISPITSLEKVTYSSSNKSVATVSAKGVITAKKAGTAKITVKSGKKKFVVTVTVPKTATSAIKNVPAAYTLKKGKSFTLKPKLAPSNSDDKITYKSSNKKVASVSSKGKITAKKKGTAVITVKSGKISVTCKVTVK